MKHLIVSCLLLITLSENTLLAQFDTSMTVSSAGPTVRPAAYVVPLVFMTAGLLTQGEIIHHVQSEVVGQYPGFSSRVDDVGQFVPILAVLGLGALYC